MLREDVGARIRALDAEIERRDQALRRLRFDRATERDFECDSFQRSRRTIRVTFALVQGVVLASAIGFPTLWPRDVGGYFALFSPILLLAASWMPKAYRFFQPVTAGLALAVGLRMAQISTAKQSAGQDLFVAIGGMLLLLTVIYTLGRLRLRWACAAAWPVVGVLANAMWKVRFDVLPAQLSYAMFLLLAGNLLGMAACLNIERSDRRDFLLRKRLEAEAAKSERLLLNVLPDAVAERLLEGEANIAESHAEVTILFADIVEFTPLAASMSPERIVEVLNTVFRRFDALAVARGLEKIKTVGDAYMLAGGLPVPRSDHAVAVADFALAAREAVRELAVEMDLPLRIKIGVHSGPAVAGVIGTSKFAYDVWGDTVNVASRMASQGVPDGIQVTERTAAALDGAFSLRDRGTIAVKGRGEMRVFLLEAREALSLAEVTPAV